MNEPSQWLNEQLGREGDDGSCVIATMWFCWGTEAETC